MTRRAGKGGKGGKRGRSYDLMFPENTQEKRVLKPQKLMADKTYFICSEDGSVAAESRTAVDLASKGILRAGTERL